VAFTSVNNSYLRLYQFHQFLHLELGFIFPANAIIWRERANGLAFFVKVSFISVGQEP
jgi:hypothetical protein